MLISEHLKFSAITEGVGSSSQLDALNEIQCHYAQDKALSEPEALAIRKLAG